MPEVRTMNFPIALIVLAVVGVSAFIALQYLQPDKDNVPLIMIIVSFLTSILTLLKAQEVQVQAVATKEQATEIKSLAKETHAEAKETKHIINSRMDELIEKTKAVAEAEGFAKGAAQQIATTAAQLEATTLTAQRLIDDAKEVARQMLEDAKEAAAAVLKTAKETMENE